MDKSKPVLFVRTCPTCGADIPYRSRLGWRDACAKNAECPDCWRPRTGVAISKGLKGKPKSEEHRRKLSEAKKGKPGHPMSEYNKERLREAIKSKPRSAEHCRKLSEARKGKPNYKLRGRQVSEEVKQRLREVNLGKKHTEESKRKMSISRKGVKRAPFSESHRRRISEANKGRKHTEEMKRNVSRAQKGHKDSEETRRRRSESMKRLYATTDLKERLAKTREPRSAESRRKTSEAMKRLYATTDFHKKLHDARKRNRRGGVRECPNKYERDLGAVLDRLFPGEYKFVGDGSFTIGRMNPDFINVNGQKKVIELFGELFHDPSVADWDIPEERTEKGRISVLKEHGFDALIIWCKELGDAGLGTKLKAFHEA